MLGSPSMDATLALDVVREMLFIVVRQWCCAFSYSFKYLACGGMSARPYSMMGLKMDM